MCEIRLLGTNSNQTKPKSQFEFAPRDTEESEVLDLVDFLERQLSRDYEKSPVFDRKSPRFCQKSRVFHQKSPVSYEKGLTFYEMSVETCSAEVVICV